MQDSAQLRKIYWKLLLIVPCIVPASGVALRPFTFEPTIMVDVCHYSWFFSPLFAIYALTVALVFFYRQDFRWSAVAFVTFGLLLQQALFVGKWWVAGRAIAP